jgi:hypothetical protein
VKPTVATLVAIALGTALLVGCRAEAPAEPAAPAPAPVAEPAPPPAVEPPPPAEPAADPAAPTDMPADPAAPADGETIGDDEDAPHSGGDKV